MGVKVVVLMPRPCCSLVYTHGHLLHQGGLRQGGHSGEGGFNHSMLGPGVTPAGPARACTTELSCVLCRASGAADIKCK